MIKRVPVRWLAGGGAALVAAAVGIALAVQTGATPACAASSTHSASSALAASARSASWALAAASARSGKATFYDSQGGGGNCSNVAAPATKLYVALGPSEYADAAACGGYLDVTGPKGKVRVLVMDQCPECAAGHIDLSKEAFAKIADPVQGIVSVTYQAVVNPSLPGPLTFRIKEGASQYWFAVLVGNHGNPLKSVEVKVGSTFKQTVRKDYNYWLYESGAGAGPYTIRLTDIYGQKATVTGVKLAPEQTQRTSVNMYGKGAPPAAAKKKSASLTPSPSRPATPTTPPPSSPASATVPEVSGAPAEPAPDAAAPALAAASCAS